LIDVSVRTDRDNRITIISPSCKRIFGYSPSELIGIPVDDYFRIAGTKDTLLELLGKNMYIDNFETELRRKDGSYVWVSINAKRLLDKQGKYTGVEATIRDISQIKKALEEKTQLQDNLRQIQKMESIGTLAGGIAHDFNNSLAGIIGAAELLRDLDITDEQRQKYINLILTAADRAGELTKKLLTFSRKGETMRKPVDIATVINDTITILCRTIDKKVAITSEFLTHNTWVIGDDALLQNVFLNLGINAGHAMPGGGSLVFTIDTTELSEEYCELSPFDLTSGKFLVITVTDSGHGMTSEVMPRIFEPFFTTKEPGKGTGLGLAAVYGTIQDHHGAITVSSTVGKGTAFYVYLPLSTKPTAWLGAQPQAPVGSGTILLIDDEDLVRITGSAILTRLGYTILTAENGRHGLTVYKDHCKEIRLVIIDMIMPVLGGRETFREVHGIDPSLPIIISSGFSGDADIEALRKQGVAGYIHKPFHRLELAEMVARLLLAGRENTGMPA
jgi:PAS domain S-box-containing protein